MRNRLFLLIQTLAVRAFTSSIVPDFIHYTNFWINNSYGILLFFFTTMCWSRKYICLDNIWTLNSSLLIWIWDNRPFIYSLWLRIYQSTSRILTITSNLIAGLFRKRFYISITLDSILHELNNSRNNFQFCFQNVFSCMIESCSYPNFTHSSSLYPAFVNSFLSYVIKNNIFRFFYFTFSLTSHDRLVSCLYFRLFYFPSQFD